MIKIFVHFCWKTDTMILLKFSKRVREHDLASSQWEDTGSQIVSFFILSMLWSLYFALSAIALIYIFFKNRLIRPNLNRPKFFLRVNTFPNNFRPILLNEQFMYICKCYLKSRIKVFSLNGENLPFSGMRLREKAS